MGDFEDNGAQMAKQSGKASRMVGTDKESQYLTVAMKFGQSLSVEFVHYYIYNHSNFCFATL